MNTWRYAVYGIRLESAQPIPELAPAPAAPPSGDPALTVDWPATPRPAEPPAWFRTWDQNGIPWLRFARLDHDAGYLLEFHQRALFRVALDGGCIDCWPANGVPAFSVRHLLLDQVLPLALSRMGRFVFHGSAVHLGGEATVVFAGPTGRGKSTLAGFFARRGFALVSDDCIVLHRNTAAGGGFVVAPGYPGVRLWRDSLAYLDGDAGICPPVAHDKDKRRYAAPDALAFAPAALPLRRFYFLTEAEPGQAASVRIEKLSGADLLRNVVASQFLLDSDDPRELSASFQGANQLAATGVCYRLSLPRNLDMLPACAAAIRRHACQTAQQEVFTMTIDETTAWVAAEGLSCSEIEGEAVVLNLTDGNFYGLNELAARVWREMSAPRTVAELARMLAGEYEVDEETARRDVTRLLADLRQRNLVQEAAA